MFSFQEMRLFGILVGESGDLVAHKRIKLSTREERGNLGKPPTRIACFFGHFHPILIEILRILSTGEK